MTKILLFSDSRGQHKPAGTNHSIFGERLRDEVKDVEVDLVLCPMKWTTTLDFIEYSRENNLKKYDWIILYTGIVEWSPRPASSAFNDLYNNKKEENLGSYSLNTRDYSKKIVNNKKKIFDELFGEKEIINYLTNPSGARYNGEKTINMYPIGMSGKVIEELNKFKNLIFINSNRILSGWDGDYKKGRPVNIDITHEYSDLFSSCFPPERLVDLRRWSDEDVKKYTCDNIHITKEGSDYIFERLIKMMSLEKMEESRSKINKINSRMEKDLGSLIEFRPLEIFNQEKNRKFLSGFTSEKYLATLIIGVRISEQDTSRLKNLEFILEWLDYYYSDLFDILIIEQDESQKLDSERYCRKHNVRYEFLYNPFDYNRGWGYNVAVKHFCESTKVVVMMDTDVLTGANFISEVRDCYLGKYKIISPYQNVYYSDEYESREIIKTKKFGFKANPKNIKNPVSITGGIVIFDKNTFLSLKGFEQYLGYSCEDRSLDVAIINLCEEDKIRIAPRAYIHLFHPTDSTARKNFKRIYGHLVDNYKCKYEPGLSPTDFIHSKCEHIVKEESLRMILERTSSFGDIDLYRHGNELTINGIKKLEVVNNHNNIILPPEFKGFPDYSCRELYDAPDPDFSELSLFYNKYLGKRCFIIGNGPSLNKHDLSLLENEITFGVNSFYYKTRETGFRPTFYVVEDSSVIKENLEEIRNYYAPFKFFPTVYSRLHPKDPNTYFFKMNRGFYEKSSPNYCVPRFSTDITKEIFCGQSVTYINLQLAYFMGFSEVYLIGMDFNYIIPESHRRTGDVLLSDTDDPNHFHKDYFGKGKTWKDPKLDRVKSNYKMAKLVYESVGRKIFNATIGGHLDVFDRVDYYDLLGGKISSSLMGGDLDKKTFSDANELFRKKDYIQAASIYCHLADKLPTFSTYRVSAFNSYLRAKELRQDIPKKLKDTIMQYL